MSEESTITPAETALLLCDALDVVSNIKSVLQTYKRMHTASDALAEIETILLPQAGESVEDKLLAVQEALQTLSNVKAQEQQELRLAKMLRKAIGYVENGTDTVVTFFQDDATCMFIVKDEKTTLFNASFEGLLQDFCNVVAAQPED